LSLSCSVMALQMRSAAMTSRSVSARPAAARRSVCASAQAEKAPAAVALAATALALTVGFSSVQPAAADVAGLTPCSESKAYAKLQKKEMKALEKRLKKYEAGSAPAIALEATMERTKNRFVNYAKAGLLCGNDGLPHLIADPGLALRYNHAGEVFIPTIGFLYVAGYIGSVGRKYIIQAKEAAKPTEKEIILDVPLALKLAFQGWAWPLEAVQELKNGKLLEDDKNITVSPR
jgi:photosystem I subunit 3